jgi:chemotaxis protein MotB
MHSEKYATNWELSVARASSVARFLVEDMKMNPQQFVVSGYSSFRPMRSNTNARNRAVNRRVEIIISKRLPTPVTATAENLK